VGNPDIFAGILAPHCVQVAAKITKYAYDLITASAFPNHLEIGAAEDFDKSGASKAETAFAKLVGTNGERSLILNFDFFDALRDSLTAIYANPTNNEILRNGVIPGISGFSKVVRTSSIPALPATNGVHLAGIATNGTGIALAVAAVRTVPEFRGSVETAVEPMSGVPLTISVDVSSDSRAYLATVEAFCGVAVLDAKGILRLTSKKGS